MADNRRQSYKMSSRRVGSGRRQPGYGPHKRGLNTKLHLAVDEDGLPVRAIITSGTVADCTVAGELIEGIDCDVLLADKKLLDPTTYVTCRISLRADYVCKYFTLLVYSV